MEVDPSSSGRTDIGRFTGHNERKRKKERKEQGSDLRSFTLDSIHHGLVSRLTEAALYASLLIVGKSGAQSLWTVVKSITKWLMDTLNGIPTSHEDLQRFSKL
jgi:hypothetical protein